MQPHVKLYLGSLLLAASQAEAGMQVCRDDAGRRFLLQVYQTAPDGWNCADDKIASAAVRTGQSPGLRLLEAKGPSAPRFKLAPSTVKSGRRRKGLEDSILISYSPPDPRLLLTPEYSAPRSYARASGRKQGMPAAAQRYDALIREAARAHGHDPNLLRAIIHVESRFNASAISPKGAIGLMQVMPSTAADLGLRNARRALFEPESNLNVGALYLRRLSERFKGNVVLMVAAFNAGENAVARYGNTIPPYAETRSYVRSVLAMYRQLEGAS